MSVGKFQSTRGRHIALDSIVDSLHMCNKQLSSSVRCISPIFVLLPSSVSFSCPLFYFRYKFLLLIGNKFASLTNSHTSFFKRSWSFIFICVFLHSPLIRFSWFLEYRNSTHRQHTIFLFLCVHGLVGKNSHTFLSYFQYNFWFWNPEWTVKFKRDDELFYRGVQHKKIN